MNNKKFNGYISGPLMVIMINQTPTMLNITATVLRKKNTSQANY